MKESLFKHSKLVLYDDYLIIKNNKIVINEIDSIFYAKWSLKNYFMLFGDYRSPGFLYVNLKKHQFYKRGYSIKLRYGDAESFFKKYKGEYEFIK